MRADGFLAVALGEAVDIERSGFVVLGVRTRLRPVEDIVGRIMHEPGAEPGGGLGEPRDRLGVDAPGAFRLRFRAVHRRVGRGVDDRLGGERMHPIHERLGSLGIRLLAPPDEEFSERGERALQLPADLAVLAEEQDPHA